MARVSDNPKKFIISCRINHHEMEVLQERAESCGMSITMLLRKSLELQEREFSKNSMMRA
jgi:glycine cleavage system pyridoxal-binding protein P